MEKFGTARLRFRDRLGPRLQACFKQNKMLAHWNKWVV